MAKTELSDLIKAMNLYDALDDRDRAHLADYVRSKTTVPKEPTAAPSAEKKSPRKGVAKLRTAITEAAKGNATDATSEPKCASCSEPQNHWSHDPTYASSHEFETKKVKTSAA